MSNTTLLLKRSAKHVRFYSPVILRGTLWVGAAALGVMVTTLHEWKVHENDITPLDVRLLWVSVSWAAITAWLTYLDKTVAHFGDEKKKRDETDAFVKSQIEKECHLR
jgi:hypothetical protein